MSLDSFRTSYEAEDDTQTEEATDVTVDDISWHVSLDGYWDDVDKRFYGENTPNEPPLVNVPEKLAADMEYSDDPQLATEVAQQLDFNSPELYEAVVTVIFNDFSTWNWPILVGGRELTGEVEHFIDDYMPEIVQWRAIVAGDDPQKALDEWHGEDEQFDFSWMDDVENTELDEDARQYFNDEASWLPHIDRVVEVPDLNDESEGHDDSWVDDW